MDLLMQRARSFASEAAKKSQELAQELALETAKRSRELALEASKRADQIKALATDINPSSIPIPSIAASLGGTFSENGNQDGDGDGDGEKRLRQYGITPELREFVKGLTIKTFEDFPLQDSDFPVEPDVAKREAQSSKPRQDLTEWQEQHALLVLKAVPEISLFRYELCPKRMKEKRFWKIYFTIVKSHIAGYEVQTRETPVVNIGGLETKDVAVVVALPAPIVKEAKPKHAVDQELDAYLMGAIGSSDDEGQDDALDADFDQLVNSAIADSDGEDEYDSKLPLSRSAGASESLSDGELVEVPSDLDFVPALSKTTT